MFRVLLPLVLAAILSAAPAAGSRGAGEDDLLGRFAGRIEEATEVTYPYLFRVIRTQSVDGSTAARIRGTGIAVGGARILTTAGLVGPASEVSVTHQTGDTLRARVVGVDRRTDLALLEVEGMDFPAIRAAEDAFLFPGDPVVAVGLGPGSGPTTSFGVAVLGQSPRLGFTETDVLQVSAPAFPGVTGGALVNLRGELVGIVSGHMALSPADAGLPAGVSLVAGFLEGGSLTTVSPRAALVALPAGLAFDIARELAAQGRVERGYLGLQVDLVPRPSRRTSPMPGVLVQRVVSGSPAGVAGLLPGDVILEYANAKVRSPENLSYLVAATVPGSEVPVLVLRRGVRSPMRVLIAQAPEPAWNPSLDESISTAAGVPGVAPAVR